MSFLARLSLANRGLIALITIVVVAFGVYITPALQQQFLPSLSFPGASVVATFAGAAPQIVEDQVTVPIEEGVRGVAGVTERTSTSRESSATIQVAFDFGTDIDDAQSKIQQVAGGLSSRLPDRVDPQVVVGNTDDLPVIQLAAASDGAQQRLAERLGTSWCRRCTGVEGVRRRR